MSLSVLAVIVLYNERLQCTLTYRSLLAQMKNIPIFIWDNSLIAQHQMSEFKNKNIIYVHCSENKGISCAYNQAAEYAYDNNYRWIMLLDQDTTFNADYFPKLIQCLKDNKEIQCFFPVHKLQNGLYLSPVRSYFKMSRLSRDKSGGKLKFKNHAIINSGLLIDVSLFKIVGGYNEKVFLDYSDFQFIERLSKYSTEGICVDSICIQNFSNNVTDFNKLLERFKLFCLSVKGCEKNSLFDHLMYFIIVLKRGVSLTIRTRSFKPIQEFFLYYILNFKKTNF